MGYFSKFALFSVLTAVVKAQAQYGVFYIEGTNYEICIHQDGTYHNDLDAVCENVSSIFYINESASPDYTFTNEAGDNCGLLNNVFTCGANVSLTPFLFHGDVSLDGYLTTVDGNGFTADNGIILGGGSQQISFINYANPSG